MVEDRTSNKDGVNESTRLLVSTADEEDGTNRSNRKKYTSWYSLVATFALIGGSFSLHHILHKMNANDDATTNMDA